MKKIINLFSNKYFVAISLICLVLSLLFKNKYFDPAIISTIISGTPLLYIAIYKLIYKQGISKISSALLISIAIFAAIYIGDIFAAGEVAFIMQIGEILEDYTTGRAKKGLKKLIDISPRTARVEINGTFEIIAAKDVKKGDKIRVLPGETISVDGKIIYGTSSVDESVITGEYVPHDKTIGDNVYSGSINKFGAIDVIAEKDGKDSSIERLIQMLKNAENNKANTQRIADKWASYLVPTALLISVLCYIFTKNIISSVTILIVFCPCALVLATPTAIMAAIGQASKNKLIIKSGTALETMGKINCICFDKTGTLTTGNLKLDSIYTNESKDKVLSKLASLESLSEHPIGKTIVDYAKYNSISIENVDDFKLSAGLGVCGTINGTKYFCGSEKYMLINNISIDDDMKNNLNQAREEGKAILLLGYNGSAKALILLSDIIRKSSKTLIDNLNKNNIHTMMLTGDNIKSAKFIANNLGINEVMAELLPEEKLKAIEDLKQKYNVCMVGDGINDSLALKYADVGIALANTASDISVDAADIALMQNDISKIYYLVKLSKSTIRTIKFGISLSMIINIVSIILSIMNVLGPTLGALVHNLGSIVVISIAAMLYDRKFE